MWIQTRQRRTRVEKKLGREELGWIKLDRNEPGWIQKMQGRTWVDKISVNKDQRGLNLLRSRQGKKCRRIGAGQGRTMQEREEEAP